MEDDDDIDDEDDYEEFNEGLTTKTIAMTMMMTMTMSFENLCVQKEVDKLWECGCFGIPC